MGCDIHICVEVGSSASQDHWFGMATDVDMNRDYNLFSKLAGVRGVEPALIEPRGLPNYISYETERYYEYWQNDAHTSAWLLLAELRLIPEMIEQPVFIYMEALAKYHNLPENKVRMVFWFDN